MDRGAWWARVHGVTKSQTQLLNNWKTDQGREGLRTDVRIKRDLADQSKNCILLKVVSSWGTGRRSCFPGYIHHEFSTTSKIFHIYVLSESACNLGCIRHLEDSNQILLAACLRRLLPLVLPQLPKQLTLVGTTQECALPPPTAHCRGACSVPTHAHLEINAPQQTAAGRYTCLPTSHQ